MCRGFFPARGELVLESFRESGRKLSEALRTRTKPLAVRFCKEEDELPKDAFWPLKRLKHRITTCQAINIARIYGYTVALTIEDEWCVPSMAFLGMTKIPDYLRKGGFLWTFHTKDQRAAEHLFECYFDRYSLPPGSTKGVVFSPLEQTSVEPHLVVVYGTPGQAINVVKGVVWQRGEPLEAHFTGAATICICMARAYLEGSIQFSLPGGGEKVFAMTEEDEVAIVIPATLLNDVLEGIENTQEMLGYPVRKYLFYEPRAPRNYPISYYDYKKSRNLTP